MKKWALRIAIGMMLVNARAHCGEIAILNQSGRIAMGQFEATSTDALILNEDGISRHHFYIHNERTEFFYIENGEFEFVIELPGIEKDFKVATLKSDMDYQIEFNPNSVWINDKCVWGIKNGAKSSIGGTECRK